MTKVHITSSFSGRLVRKGVLVEETYRVLACWDTHRTLRDNIQSIRRDNPTGSSNQAWLKEITSTVSNRFSHGDPLAPLATLARGGMPIETWKYCLLWHLGSTDGLYTAFVGEFLIPLIDTGVAMFTTDDVIPFVRDLESRGVFEASLTDYGRLRMARDLLRAAAAFGFVEGSSRRELRHPVIPEDALLYAIYSLWDATPSTERLIHSVRWRLFLMTPPQVEHELLNLHQFRRLHYQHAGSVRELSLPHASLPDFTRSLVP